MSKRFTYWNSFASVPPYTPFFTTFPNGLEGFSLDRLVDGYSDPVLNIVRPSDLAERDIYLDGNSTNLDDILSFVGNEKALVKDVHGQLGNFTASQTNTAKMPIIADGGEIKMDNGKPCIVFDGVDDELTITGFSYNPALITAFLVRRHLTTTGSQMAWSIGGSGASQLYVWINGGLDRVFYNGNASVYTLTPDTDRNLIDMISNATNAKFSVDGNLEGTQAVSGLSGSIFFYIGGYFSINSLCANMNFQELILFDNADRTSEAAAMRANINDRYTIY